MMELVKETVDRRGTHKKRAKDPKSYKPSRGKVQKNKKKKKK